MEIRSTTPDLPVAQVWDDLLSGWPGEDTDEVAERVLRLFAPGGDALDDEAAMDVRVSEMMRTPPGDPLLRSARGAAGMAEGFGETRLPALPRDPGAYLDQLEAQLIPRAVRALSPRFIGGGTGAQPYFVAPLLRLAAALRRDAGPAGTSLDALERQALARMHRLIYGQPDAFYDRHAQDAGSTLGIVTSGGTPAGVTALACARNHRLGPDGAFRGVEAAGVAEALAHHGARGMAVIGSAQMDTSFETAMALLGLGTGHIFRVPTDPGGGVDPRALRAAVDHCRDHHLLVLALVGVAGSRDAGSVDDLHAVADLAAECGAHFHVDAGGSGPAPFSESYRPLLAGMERADTVTFDAHAQLYLPHGTGILLLRDPGLAADRDPHAQHNGRARSGDAGGHALESAAPAASLLLHAALELIGERGYAVLAEEGIRKARYLADAVRARGELELLCEPRLNVVLYRYVPEEWRARVKAGTLTREAQRRIGAFNEALWRAQCERGRTSVSRVTTSATLYGPNVPVTALRAVLANPLTTTDDIDLVLEDQAELAAGLGR